MSTVYGGAALGVLLFHVAWLMFVVFGALVTRGRRFLTALHLAALIWALVVEVGPWPCPLTALEQGFWRRADAAGYSGGFLLHYLDRLIYPGVPEAVLTAGAAVVVAVNVVVYVHRFRKLRT